MAVVSQDSPAGREVQVHYDTGIYIPRAQAGSPQRSYLSCLIFALCAGVYFLPFMRVLLQGTDEGFLIDGAVRVTHGQVFARDFFEVVGPGTFYWLSAFFKVLGVTFFATRVWLFLDSLGTALLMYFLSRRICSQYQSLPAILFFATSFGMLWPAISHHTDSNFFALLAFACVILWQDFRNSIFLVAAGVFAGATTCFLQPKGVLLLLAILVWLLVQHRRQFNSIRSLGWVACGYCGVAGAVCVYFWNRAALRDLLYTNLVWPFQHYDAISNVPYGRGILLYYWDHWVVIGGGSPWIIAIAAVMITPFLLVAALPALLPALGWERRRFSAKPEILLYWLCGWALWVSEIHRKDICHLVYGSPLLIILVVSLLGRSDGKPSRIALQIFFVSASCLAVFNLFTVLPAEAVSTRAGSVAMFNRDPVLAYLDQHVAPGTE
ncbi:MAG TPA: glycosyltransferase family 39 protein, partial [Candidatus Angelobacter sp.]|nr:glycosyltransferase family 39 protein [Candidatus Angelobacter sp.]